MAHLFFVYFYSHNRKHDFFTNKKNKDKSVGMAGWGDNNSISVKQYDNLFVCGDGRSAVSEEAPPFAPRVGIVSNMQANHALELLLR
ncbi:MAG: hypothetical protein HY958_12105 [Bacteroidia bacterium]|nr:hypothetical protein [Bacteroidia bacterium]